MSDTMKLALQLTAIDMLSGVVERAKRHILSLGPAGQSVKKDFDDMTRHISSALKNIAVANYTIHKIGQGIKPAADLQESMIDVRMSLMRSGKDAAVLNAELSKVRATAVDLQKITPFSAQDVVDVQKELLNSGLEFNEVVGKGAARAAMMLATITKETPKAATDAMLNIGIPYHLKSSGYGDVADVIQKHVMSGRMKLPDLNAALPYAAPVAKQFKVPWDDLLTGMAVLGEQGQLGSMAGTHLKDFYGRLTGASRISRKVMAAVNQDLQGKGHAPLEFWDKKGEMLPTHDLIKNLRTSMGSYNTKQRMFILEKIFGEQGGLAAMALMSTGTGSWEFVKGKVLEVAKAEEKMTERLKGFNANVTALGGTAKTTLATMFDPMLAPLTLATQKMNDLVDGAGKLAEKHPALTATGNAVLAGTAAYFGGKAIWGLAKGGIAGSRVLKGLKGLSGTGMGIAEGKMIQAATGVQPVFVTNWPANLGGSAVADAIGGIAGGGIAAGGGKKAAGWLARKFGILAGSSMGLASAELLPILAAGGVGYGVGTGLNYGLGGLSGWASGGKYKGAGWAGEQIYDMFNPATANNRLQKNDIKIDLQIDSSGRVFARSNDMSTSAGIGGKRGSFFDALMTTEAM